MTIRSVKSGELASLAGANTSVATPTPPTDLTPTKDTIDGGKINIAFTPAVIGSTATSYIATSSPGGFTGTANSSPVSVTGLTGGTSYTFTVAGINANGTGPASPSSNAQTAPVLTSTTFNTTGNWTAPAGVNSIELLMVAGGGGGGNATGSMGGGGGGAGGFIRNTATSVTPGTNYAITVGTGGGGGTAGNASNAFSLTAVGGGQGGNGSNTLNVNTGANSGGSGGSGGGGGANTGGGAAGNGNGGAGTAGQGNSGNAGQPNRNGGNGGGLSVTWYGVTYAQAGLGAGPIGFTQPSNAGYAAGSGGGGGGGASSNNTNAPSAGANGSVVIRYVS